MASFADRGPDAVASRSADAAKKATSGLVRKPWPVAAGSTTGAAARHLAIAGTRALGRAEDSEAMQLIEDTPLGVRAAVMTLAHPRSNVRFVTVPMMHLGTPDFYARVQRLMASCDVVVSEGVGGRRVAVLTLAYRLAGRFNPGRLVLQSEALDLGSLPAKIVNPDMTADQFDAAWARIRWWWRPVISVAAVFVGVSMTIVGAEAFIRSRSLTFEDFPSADEVDDDEIGLEELILHSRDRLLCTELARLAAEPHDQRVTIGIPWGAHHMRAVMQTLGHDLGYRVVDAAWLTIL